jgi:hypothetical protein
LLAANILPIDGYRASGELEMSRMQQRAAAHQDHEFPNSDDRDIAPVLKPVFKEVLIFSPSVKTGGPEALHQLGYRIARNGGMARMVYYGVPLTVEGNVFRCGKGPFPLLEHFAQYQPQVLRESVLAAETLLVFPEPLSKTAAIFRSQPCQRALWWLSVDNALQSNPELLEQDSARTFFADRDLSHFYQSEYARTALMNNKAQRYLPLSDYTDPQFIQRSLTASDNAPIRFRNNNVCFFPNKGRELARHFLTCDTSLRNQVEFKAIRDMTKAQVRDTLFQARVYIDFGHHPGKDRVPREAAIAGAVVLLHSAGAANFFGDHPLSPDYRFTQDDVLSGRLHQRLDDILDDPEAHFAAQRLYRQHILLEQERFDIEVRSSFFTRV